MSCGRDGRLNLILLFLEKRADKFYVIAYLRTIGYHTGEIAVFGPYRHFSFVEMLKSGGNFLYIGQPKFGYT